MGDLKIQNSTTTDLSSAVSTYSVNAESPDRSDANHNETWYDFPDSDQYMGYYKQIPELKKAIDALAIWSTGLGIKVENNRDDAILNRINGMGTDSFNDILFNLFVMKKVHGDAFAEVIRNEKGTLLNIKPLYTGDMRIVTNKKGIILRYELRTKDNVTKFQPNEILHLCNDRVANEIHGTSVIESCKWVIDARNEALEDERKIRHRELALGILEVDTDDTSRINSAKSAYQDAVNKGEVLVLPKGEAEIKDNPNTPRDRLQWIQYLENFFYQAVGVPRVIATSENYTEAASKVGFLTFEPIYTHEQKLLEQDLWNQMGIRITFNRPPSLSNHLQTSEEKNTGQLNFQPKDTQVNLNRE